MLLVQYTILDIYRYYTVRRSRVIGDWGGYRRLIVDFALFGREGLARKGSC
jgi:hypothetical protein